MTELSTNSGLIIKSDSVSVLLFHFFFLICCFQNKTFAKNSSNCFSLLQSWLTGKSEYVLKVGFPAKILVFFLIPVAIFSN